MPSFYTWKCSSAKNTTFERLSNCSQFSKQEVQTLRSYAGIYTLEKHKQWAFNFLKINNITWESCPKCKRRETPNMWYRNCTKVTAIAMPAQSELTTHSLRDSFHCIFTSKLIFPSAEFKSLSLVHAQITTYWEKRPLCSLRHSRCCQSRISQDSRRPAQPCSERRRGKV